MIDLQANVLFALDGEAMAPRFDVNPDWRGPTAQGAMIPATGTTRFQTGPPPAAVRAFLRP